jgi:hypothetical protein
MNYPLPRGKYYCRYSEVLLNREANERGAGAGEIVAKSVIYKRCASLPGTLTSVAKQREFSLSS